MTFTESNTVEQMILDAIARRGDQTDSVSKTESVWPSVLREVSPGYGESLGGELRPDRWDYVPAAQIPRTTTCATSSPSSIPCSEPYGRRFPPTRCSALTRKITVG